MKMETKSREKGCLVTKKSTEQGKTLCEAITKTWKTDESRVKEGLPLDEQFGVVGKSHGRV